MIKKFHWKVGLLSLCYAFSSTSASLTVLAASLVGIRLSPDPTWATLPLTLQLLGTMTAGLPASLLMKRVGRNIGFLLGTLIGTLGGVLSAWAITIEDFVLFNLGIFMLGLMRGFTQLYRFSAVDVVPVYFKPHAISLVLAGGILAGFLGPEIGSRTIKWLPDYQFAGSYWVVALLLLISVPILLLVRLPKPSEEEKTGTTRSLGEISRNPVFFVALFSACVGYAVMALIMTATPLSMKSFNHGVWDTAIVIQWHVVGMFAPSFFTGALIERFGHLKIMVTGLLLKFLCIAVNLIDQELLNFWTGLLLLGVGWNFLFVTGTSMLTETYKPAEKAKVQGFNDRLVFATAAAFSMMAGVLQHSIGWIMLNFYCLPLLVFTALVLIWFHFRKGTEYGTVQENPVGFTSANWKRFPIIKKK